MNNCPVTADTARYYAAESEAQRRDDAISDLMQPQYKRLTETASGIDTVLTENLYNDDNAAAEWHGRIAKLMAAKSDSEKLAAANGLRFLIDSVADGLAADAAHDDLVALRAESMAA